MIFSRTRGDLIVEFLMTQIYNSSRPTQFIKKHIHIYIALYDVCF